MAAHLLSLNVGRAEPSTAKNVGVTGIAKRPRAYRRRSVERR